MLTNYFLGAIVVLLFLHYLHDRKMLNHADHHADRTFALNEEFWETHIVIPRECIKHEERDRYN
jgi:hypothetical protein